MNEDIFELMKVPSELNLPGFLQDKEAHYMKFTSSVREFVEWMDLYFSRVNLEFWPLFFLGFIIVKDLEGGEKL